MIPMKRQLQQFHHEEFGGIRAVSIDGEPWFVGKDVAEALGYQNGSRDVNRHVDEEDRKSMMIPQYQNGTLVSRTTLINESGLYSLILSSTLPLAKKFKRWVTSEILPSIRRTGSYTQEPHPFTTPEGVSVLCHAYLELEDENNQLTGQVEALAPKARYYDYILQSKSLLQTSVIAKDYGMSAVAFNRLLRDLRIQYRMGSGTWLLYQEHAGQGYTKTRTYRASENTSVVHTYWTQKGRLFLYEQLKQEGIIPCMESDDPADLETGGDGP